VAVELRPGLLLGVVAGELLPAAVGVLRADVADERRLGLTLALVGERDELRVLLDDLVEEAPRDVVRDRLSVPRSAREADDRDLDGRRLPPLGVALLGLGVARVEALGDARELSGLLVVSVGVEVLAVGEGLLARLLGELGPN